jgi:RNA 2',3'-cyclic 3'-phosphodiesterase
VSDVPARTSGTLRAGRARLFVALDLPSEVRTMLVDWAAVSLDAVPGIRLQTAGSLHVTLCFLGDVNAGAVPEVAAACGVAGRWGPMAMQLGTPLWLPGRRPRVAAVSVAGVSGGGSGELADLQATVAGALTAGGWYRPERRPFLAHVTLARIGTAGPLHPPDIAAPAPLRFNAPSVTLYRSHPGPSGARYEPLTTVMLRG